MQNGQTQRPATLAQRVRRCPSREPENFRSFLQRGQSLRMHCVFSCPIKKPPQVSLEWLNEARCTRGLLSLWTCRGSNSGPESFQLHPHPRACSPYPLRLGCVDSAAPPTPLDSSLLSPRRGQSAISCGFTPTLLLEHLLGSMAQAAARAGRAVALSFADNDVQLFTAVLEPLTRRCSLLLPVETISRPSVQVSHAFLANASIFVVVSFRSST